MIEEKIEELEIVDDLHQVEKQDEKEVEDLSKPLKFKFNKKKRLIYGGIFLALVLLYYGVKLFVLTINGSGKFIEQEMVLDIFDNIELNIDANLYITQGDSYFKIVAEQEILDKINIISNKGKLVISKKAFYSIHPSAPIEIYLTTNALNSLEINGAGKMISQDQITATKLEISVNGSADVNLQVHVNDLTTNVEGAGDVIYKGKTKTHNINISGSSTVKSFDLIAKKVNIKVSGSGICDVFASENLDVRISGSGKIYYKGEPKVTQSVSGSGKIRKSE